MPSSSEIQTRDLKKQAVGWYEVVPIVLVSDGRQILLACSGFEHIYE